MPAHKQKELRVILQIQSFLLRSKGFVPHISHSSPWDLHWRDKPPKHLALKPIGLTFRKNSAIGNGDPTLRGFASKHIHFGTKYKSSRLKSVQTICERESLLTLRYLLEGQILLRLSSNKAPVDIFSAFSLYFANAGMIRAIFALSLHLNAYKKLTSYVRTHTD